LPRHSWRVSRARKKPQEILSKDSALFVFFSHFLALVPFLVVFQHGGAGTGAPERGGRVAFISLSLPQIFILLLPRVFSDGRFLSERKPASMRM
jgi:hypothetical protein